MTRYFVQVKRARWHTVYECEARQWAHALAYVMRGKARVCSERSLRKQGMAEAVKQAESDLRKAEPIDQEVTRRARTLVREALSQVSKKLEARTIADEEYRAAIRQAYEVGYTLGEVAEAAQLSTERVRQIVHENPTSRVIKSPT